jgi:hypothetical protein
MEMKKCVGCGGMAEHPHHKGEGPHYCGKCWQARTQAFRDAAKRIGFTRWLRNSHAEAWTIRDELKDADNVIGEVWAALDCDGKSPHFCILLFDVFDWSADVYFTLPDGVIASETYRDLISGRVFEFFESAFPLGFWSASIYSVKGKGDYVEIEM